MVGKGAILEEPGGLSPLAKSSGKRWAVSHLNSKGRVPHRGHGKCTHSEVRTFLTCSRKSKITNVTGTEQEGHESREDRGTAKRPWKVLSGVPWTDIC